nr:MAG TPA: hypothetical protein [Caudoviricetes sp.]
MQYAKEVGIRSLRLYGFNFLQSLKNIIIKSRTQ